MLQVAPMSHNVAQTNTKITFKNQLLTRSDMKDKILKL